MFVHETHSFFVLTTINVPKGLPLEYYSKKLGFFNKALVNVGAEIVGAHVTTWMLNDVMYAAAADVYDIIVNEINRVVHSDASLSAEEKKLYSVSLDSDKLLISEYMVENTFIK